MLRSAHIYIADAGKPAIVAAMHHNVEGVSYEQDGAIAVPSWREGEALPAALRMALERFSRKDRNLRDYKKTDWPAYRASECHSVREFERIYLLLSVQALNQAELFYDVNALPRGEDDIALHVTLNRYGTDGEMARKLFKPFDACAEWQAHLG